MSFQQNNAGTHSSNETKTWFEMLKMPVMPWPAKSTNLNHIEIPWGVFSRQLSAGGSQFESVADLKRQVEKVWDKVDDQLRHNLVASVAKR